jgi:hypothetical protein
MNFSEIWFGCVYLNLYRKFNCSYWSSITPTVDDAEIEFHWFSQKMADHRKKLIHVIKCTVTANKRLITFCSCYVLENELLCNSGPTFKFPTM